MTKYYHFGKAQTKKKLLTFNALHALKHDVDSDAADNTLTLMESNRVQQSNNLDANLVITNQYNKNSIKNNSKQNINYFRKTCDTPSM